MKRKRFSVEQIAAVLKQAEVGVLPERFESGESPHFAAGPFERGHIPEAAAGSVVSLTRRHALLDQLLLAHG